MGPDELGDDDAPIRWPSERAVEDFVRPRLRRVGRRDIEKELLAGGQLDNLLRWLGEVALTGIVGNYAYHEFVAMLRRLRDGHRELVEGWDPEHWFLRMIDSKEWDELRLSRSKSDRKRVYIERKFEGKAETRLVQLVLSNNKQRRRRKDRTLTRPAAPARNETTHSSRPPRRKREQEP
jgi:hypothetical protein